jgi:hypothetical protein
MLRLMIDDTGTPPVFTDPELELFYAQSGSNLNRTALSIIRVLMMRGAKYTDYVQNQSQEKRSQVFSNLEKMYGIYQAELAQGAQQVRIVGVRSIPPNRKATPDGDCAEWET